METILTRNQPEAAHAAHSGGWERATLACGAIYSALHFAAVAYATVAAIPPPLDVPLAGRAAWYAQHGTELAIGGYLLALPVPWFLCFLGGLFVALRRSAGDAPAVAAAVCGTASAMIWPLGALLASLGSTIARNGGDPATVLALDGMAPLALALGAVPRAAFIGIASLALLGGRRVPRWIAWSGLGVGVLTLTGSALPLNAALFPALALGQLLFLVWNALLAGMLLRGMRVGRAPRVGVAVAAA